jgi:hypothetical protein
MGWITSGMLPTTTTHSAASPPAPRPTTMTDDTTCSQPHEQLLVGWIAGGTALMTTAHPTTAPPASRPYNNDEQHTTHPQPHEQLLVGWIAGGTAPTMTARPATSSPAPRPMTTMDDTPPAPSLTSNCSWGGLRVERQRQGATTTSRHTANTYATRRAGERDRRHEEEMLQETTARGSCHCDPFFFVFIFM